jgi:hypothetical protein
MPMDEKQSNIHFEVQIFTITHVLYIRGILIVGRFEALK